MTHEEKIARWIGRGKIGVEIGAFKSPLPGLSPTPFYVDCFGEFGGEKVHADYYGHACSLPFRDDSLDYVITSHVLEHVANPIAAFAEWQRVLRPGGIVYLLVPDRRFTWDRPRPVTPVAHFLEDFERNTTACDATHIDDFVFGVDWSTYSPATPPAEIDAERAARARGMQEAVRRGEEINIHFHTFEPENLLGLLAQLRTWSGARFDWAVVDHAERFPANNPIGFLVVARVNKSWPHHFASWRNRSRTAHDPKYPVRPGARAFDDFAADSAPKPPVPACIDEPAENAVVDPKQLFVRGWLWLGEAHANLVAVEARIDGVLAGKTTEFGERRDVVAAFGLAPEARPGFEFTVQSPAKPGARLQLDVHVRLRDGTTPLVATRSVTAGPASVSP